MASDLGQLGAPQAGFREERREQDPVIVLHSIKATSSRR